ncbi:hypothetical protein ACQ4PT_058106 [Festuca glaucescens]
MFAEQWRSEREQGGGEAMARSVAHHGVLARSVVRASTWPCTLWRDWASWARSGLGVAVLLFDHGEYRGAQGGLGTSPRHGEESERSRQERRTQVISSDEDFVIAPSQQASAGDEEDDGEGHNEPREEEDSHAETASSGPGGANSKIGVKRACWVAADEGPKRKKKKAHGTHRAMSPAHSAASTEVPSVKETGDEGRTAEDTTPPSPRPPSPATRIEEGRQEEAPEAPPHAPSPPRAEDGPTAEEVLAAVEKLAVEERLAEERRIAEAKLAAEKCAAEEKIATEKELTAGQAKATGTPPPEVPMTGAGGPAPALYEDRGALGRPDESARVRHEEARREAKELRDGARDEVEEILEEARGRIEAVEEREEALAARERDLAVREKSITTREGEVSSQRQELEQREKEVVHRENDLTVRENELSLERVRLEMLDGHLDESRKRLKHDKATFDKRLARANAKLVEKEKGLQEKKALEEVKQKLVKELKGVRASLDKVTQDKNATAGEVSRLEDELTSLREQIGPVTEAIEKNWQEALAALTLKRERCKMFHELSARASSAVERLGARDFRIPSNDDDAAFL